MLKTTFPILVSLQLSETMLASLLNVFAAIPPDLSWSTPSPTLCRVEIPSPTRHSPRLSPFEWFHAFGEFIHESAVGSPVLESDNILGLLRTFVGFVPTYALQREYSNHVRSLQVTHHCPHCWISFAMKEIRGLYRREQDPNKAQALLGAAIDDYLSAIDHKGSSLPTPCEDLQNCIPRFAKISPVVNTVAQACLLYTITGKDEEAALLLVELVCYVGREIPELYKLQDAYYYVLKAMVYCSIEEYIERRGAYLLNEYPGANEYPGVRTLGETAEKMGEIVTMIMGTRRGKHQRRP